MDVWCENIAFLENWQKRRFLFRSVPHARSLRGTKMGKFCEIADYCLRLFQELVRTLRQKWAKTPILVQSCSVRAPCEMNKNQCFSTFRQNVYV
jgi:hypothetical protein